MRLSLLILLASSLAFAEAKVDRTQVLVSLTGSYHYTNSLADQVAGAGYTERFANPVSAEIAVGFLAEPAYIGVAYDYWFTRRAFTLGGIESVDTLRYHSIGLELGYVSRNPRVILTILGGVFYPIERKVSGLGGIEYEATDMRFAYRARVQIGVRFNQSFSLLFGGGYRWSQLGNLNAGGTPFLSGGASLDMTGAFLDGGFGFSF